MGRSNARKRRRQVRPAKVGIDAGCPVFTGAASDRPIQVRVFDYDPGHLTEVTLTTASELATFVQRPTTTWIHVDGLHDAALVQSLGEALGLHPLWVEDILNPHTRSKVEAAGDRHLLITRAVTPRTDGDDPWAFEIEQNAFLLGPRFLVSFQERGGDPWEPTRARLRAASTRLRREGPDALLHALLDAVVDDGLVVLERLESAVNDLEDAALLPATRDVPARMAALKSDLLTLRSAFLPMREVLGALRHGEAALISREARPYFQDALDHVEQALDAVDALRDRAVVALELHLAVANQQLNEVLRLLTLVSTFFMPLTFIAGIYGMNFAYMPELAWRWGYFAVLGVMALLGLTMLAVFRWRRWL